MLDDSKGAMDLNFEGCLELYGLWQVAGFDYSILSYADSMCAFAGEFELFCRAE